MVAGLKEADAAHDHVADGELPIQKLDEWNTAGDNIAPRFVAKHLRAQLGRGLLDSFLFDKTYRFVWPFGRIPRFAKKAVAFQAAVCKRAHFGHTDHRFGRLWSDVQRDNFTLPVGAGDFKTAP